MWCCCHPRSIIALSALVFAFSAWTLVTRIAVVTDTDAMIDASLPFRTDYAQFQANYPLLGDTVVVIIEADAPEIARRTAHQLSAALEQDKRYFSSVTAPAILPFFEENGLLLLDYETLTDRLDRLIEAQPLLGPLLRQPSLARFMNSLAEIVEKQDPDTKTEQLAGILTAIEQTGQAVLNVQPGVLSLQNAVLNQRSQDIILLTAQPVLDRSQIEPAAAALAALRAHVDAAERKSAAPVRMSITGKIALNEEELETVSAGAATAGLLSGFLVAVILAYGVRSWRGVAAMLINLVFGLVATGSAALWLFGALNIISVAFAVLFIGLGIDFSIHILLRAQEDSTADANETMLAQALSKAAGTSGIALAICAPTTALAFLSFTPTGYAGLAQLGAIAAIGVFIAMISAVTLLPALLIVLRFQSNTLSRKPWKLSLRAPRMLVFVPMGMALPALYLAAQIGFEADPIALKDPEASSVIAYNRLAARKETSPYAIQLVAAGQQSAQELLQAARQLPSVGQVVWAGSFMPQEQADKLDLIAETYDLLAPDLVSVDARKASDQSAALQALQRLHALTPSDVLAAFIQQPLLISELEERLLETLPDLRTTLRRQLRTTGVERLPPALEALYRGRDGSYRLELFPAQPIADEASLEAFVDAVKAAFPSATGSPVQIIEAGRIVRTSMLQATGIAFVSVVSFLFIVLRSLKQLFFVLVPVVLAGIFTLATSVLAGLSFNFANVIVLPLLIGLGVDAGIHYVKRAFEPGAEQNVGTTGRAVFLSSATTIGSFGTLMVSKHAGTASMGLLLTISLCWLLFTTLVVLPALLEVMDAKGAPSQT